MEYYGRNDANIKVIFPADKPIAKDSASVSSSHINASLRKIQAGDFVVARITEANSQVLKGVPLYHTTIGKHSAKQNSNWQLAAYSIRDVSSCHSFWEEN